MPNVRTISQVDLDQYGDLLKGKSVGDTITAQEDYELREAYAKRQQEQGQTVINRDTGLTGQPNSVETPSGVPADDEDSEAAESKRTRHAVSARK